MNLQERISNVIIPCLVAKLDVDGAYFEKFGLYPNKVDSFIITREMSDRSESIVNADTTMKLSLGSKMIGAYRDKGSVTAIPDEEFEILCDFECTDGEEVNNLVLFLEQMRKKVVNVSGNKVTFIPDVIAGTSTGRDNVNALLINGLVELDCILEDMDCEITVEELSELTIQDVAGDKKRDHRVYIVNKDGQVVHDFGEHLIIFENFFWQPAHDNSTYIRKKDINCLYSQCIDGYQIYNPELYKAIQNSIDTNSIKEDLLCLGMRFDMPEHIEDAINDREIESFNELF